ncbi:MAG: serine/threonine-protein kinase [Phycisphaerales bacterium]
MDQSRVNEAFDKVLAAPPDERAAALDRACGTDQELRRAVTELLSALDRAGAFLANPTADAGDSSRGPHRKSSLVGSCVGPYKLLELIGEGGFGSVYLAEQTAPIRRRVAVKVLKPGMDSRSVVGRFEAERQALALMDHPNIAKVFDAGTTAPGQGSLPYFAMELVRGVPITQFCDDARLPPRARLEILQSVCLAVQHAHAKGVIHRDLKPGNVLVTLHDGKPVPKVIDFGIAKATGASLTDKTVFTEFRALIGTPAYMSPEQAEMSGLDIDTRSDVYSLGVLMYELLTGSAPFDSAALARAGLAEVQRIIREEEPARPSTRLSTAGQALRTIADRRQSSPERLTRLVRGELDWIVMRAMEKERSRRYTTADAMAADIARFLAGEPVLAAPPSGLYRARKFVRRHRGPVVAGTVVVIAVLAGLAGTTWGLLDAKAGRREAEKSNEAATDALKAAEASRALEARAAAAAVGQARRARAAADLMRWGLAEQTQRAGGAPPLSARELLEKMIQRTDQQTWSSAVEETYARAALADLLLAAGEFRLAQEQTDRLRLAWERDGAPDPETVMTTAWTAVEVERALWKSSARPYWEPTLREQTFRACESVAPALRERFEAVVRPALSLESVTTDEYTARSAAFRECLTSTRPSDEVIAGMAWTLHACRWGRWQRDYVWPLAGGFLDNLEAVIAALPERSGLRERLLLAECDALHLRLVRSDAVSWDRISDLADAVDRLGEGAWIRGALDCHVGKAMVLAAGKDALERRRQGIDRAARGFARIREATMPHQYLLLSAIGAFFDTVALTDDAALLERGLGPIDASVSAALREVGRPDLLADLPRAAEDFRRLAAALDAHPIAEAGTRRIVATCIAANSAGVIDSGGGGTWRDIDQAILPLVERADRLFANSGDPAWTVSAKLALNGAIIAYAGPDRDVVHRLGERGAEIASRIDDRAAAIVCRGTEGLWCMHHDQVEEGIRILRRYADEAIALGPPDSDVWNHATPFVVYLAKREQWEDLARELPRILPWMADSRGRVPPLQLMRVARVALFQPNPSREVCEQVVAVGDRYMNIAPDKVYGPLLKGLALAWLGRDDEALESLDEASRRLAREDVNSTTIMMALVDAVRAVAFTHRRDAANAAEALAAVERTEIETMQAAAELSHFRERVRQRVAEAAAAASSDRPPR